MAFPTIPIALVTVQTACFGLALFLSATVYYRYRFFANLLLTVAFGELLISGILRFIVNYSTDIRLVRLSWLFQNFFLIIGILFVFYAFIFYQHRTWPFYTNFVSLWGGATILVYSMPELIKISYDPLFGWNATYDPLVSIFASPLILFFILAFIRPIFVKMRATHDVNVRRAGYFLILSFSISLVWALFSAVTMFEWIRFFRPFMLPIGWLIWAVVIWKNPLALIFTNASMDRILIASESGLPVFYYDLEKQQIDSEDATLASGVLAALTSGLIEMFASGGVNQPLESIRYENQIVTVRRIKSGYLFFGFSRVADASLTSAFNVFIEQFQEKYEYHLNQKTAIVEREIFEPAVELVSAVFDSVHV